LIAEIADAEHVVASDCCRPLGWPAAVSWWRCAAGSRAIAGYPSSTWPMYALTRTPWPFADLNPPTVYLSHENAARLPVHGSSLAFRAVGRPEGLTLMFDIATSVPEQRGWSTYVFYQRKQVRCSDANMVVAKTGMITAAIDVAVRGQAIEAVCHCSGWRRRGQDVPMQFAGLP